MMQIKTSGFSPHSSLALNHFINENIIDIVAVSEAHGSVSGFENNDIQRSTDRKHSSTLSVRKTFWKIKQ